MSLLASLQARGVSQYLSSLALSAVQRVGALLASSCPGNSSGVQQQCQWPGTSAAPGSSACQPAADGVGVASAAGLALWVRSCSQAGVTPTVRPGLLLLLSGQQSPAGLALPVLGISSRSRASSNRGYAAASRPPTKLNAPQLTRLISKATKPEQVLALVQQHAADMDFKHISAAYSRLSKLCKEGAASAQTAAVQEALGLLEPLVQKQMYCFGARELVTIIHACHYLECKHTMLQLLPVFLQPPMLGTANTQGVANVLWAAAKSGIVLQDSEVQQLLQRLCARLEGAVPQDISNSVYAVAEMGKQLSGVQLQQLIGALCGMLDRANPQALANLLLAVAKLGQQLPPEQLQQLLTAFTAQLHTAKPQELANTLWAVAKLGQQVPPAQLQQLLTASTKQLHRAKPQELANTLWACASVFRVLPSQLVTALEQQPQQLQRLMSAANAQNLANMTLACAWLGFRRTFLLDALLQQAVTLLQHQGSSKLNCQACANLCWSVAVLDLQLHAPKVLQLAGACSKQWYVTVPENLQQLYQAHLWLLDCQLPAGSSSKGLGVVLTQQQLEQCRVSCEQVLLAETKVSQLQQAVFAALQRLPDVSWQQQPALEQPTADNAAVIDIVAVTARGVKLAIEVDGPSHFVQPGNQLDGPTQHRDRVLAARDYTVVSIPYWEWNGLSSQQQQVEYLQCKLAEHL